MNVPVKLAAFGLAALVAFAGAWTAGRLIGPGRQTQPVVATEHDTGHADEARGSAPPRGLASAEHGYRLTVGATTLPAAEPREFRFRITGTTGEPVTRFAVEHDRLMHLVVVRRDGTHYQHLHPSLDADGTWSVPLTFTAAGSYRAFADFRPEGGDRTTLGVDVHVPGDYRPVSVDGERHTFTVEDYAVHLEHAAGTVTATVTKDGRPVTDLQPYLGAYGHLVALRTGDLAYLHVHPHESTLRFDVDFPTPGGYRLFLDFQHEGTVRTAEFTVESP